MTTESRTVRTSDLVTPVHLLIAQQAATTPRAIAVVDGAQQISYAELDARADLLADRLRERGARADMPVGVGLRRGIDLVTALLAVWKAGAAYVTLDPDDPWQRLSWMLADTGARVVVTDEELADSVRRAGVEPLPPQSSTSTPDSGRRVGSSDTGAAITGSQAAYVLYTSGSTGHPKGVVVSHAGIANHLAWVVAQHGLGPSDRVLLKTSMTFDAAGWEVFAPLVSGGTVVIAPTGVERDTAALLRTVAEQDVTVLQVVPSVLRLLVEESGWENCTGLRLVSSGGEPLYAELAQRLLARRKVEVWNTYGPTECTIEVTAHRFDPAQLSGPVPIGRPINGMRVLVLDPSGDPVDIGVRGELYAGGPGVARGYLGQPGRTAASFVPDPYAKDGGRLYRTGDMVRWSEEGHLEYLGRADDQVKINGVRIEPGEIETHLASHPGLEGAVVRPFRTDGGKRLAAYIKIRPTAEGVTTDTLRLFLDERLPISHRPAVFMEMAEFPLTASGKIDRSALPEPDATSEGAPASRTPRTAEERLVADIWQELLGGVSGIQDDFFHRGGTSLHLTRLANRLRSASGNEIQLMQLFEATTIEDQAKLLGAGRKALPVIPVPRTGPLPLSQGQRRLWFLEQLNPHSPEWIAATFFQVPTEVPETTVRRCLDALVARHESLRTRFTLDNGEPRQIIDPPASADLRVVEATTEELRELLVAEASRGFDLANGPVLRAILARVAGAGQTLILATHHIVCDGWSSVVLKRDFEALLKAHGAGRAAALPPLRVQYADYAVWQQEAIDEETTERELRYWARSLHNMPALALHTDRPRPAVRDARGAVVPITVSPELCAAVAELGRRHGATPFVTLLTAYATLLARYTGQWDVPVGTPVAGRDRPETEGVVGFFLNSLVVRCALSADLTFEQALERVRAVFRDALAHQALPFDQLVAELAPERDLSRTPLYQVAFNLHDEENAEMAVEPADFRLLEGVWRVAKTDLSLFLSPRSDGGMAGVLEYATALFDRRTVARMARHFQRVLAAVVAAPAERLDAIALLTETELSDLDAWSGTPAASPADIHPPVHRCVYQDIENQALATPDAPAVRANGVVTTYAELDARANRLAHRLAELGVRPESRVAVLLDRSADLLAALLAVWKAGGAYTPLDPSHPSERLIDTLATAHPLVVVTSTAHRDRLGDLASTRWLVLDDPAEAARTADAPTTAPSRAADLDSLAYTIFTSGSTGRPKGVSITHRGLANHLAWAVAALARPGSADAPVFSSVAFDLVVPNLWAPLLAGGAVTMLAQDLDLTALGTELAARGPFGFLKMTPSHLEILLEQLTEGQAKKLAEICVVAGEALPTRLADRWPGRIINEYGPTEASVGTSILALDNGVVGGDVVPIGRPLPHMTMHVLDSGMRRLPIGVVGELYVGGTGVARGYADQPALTASRFLPDPYGPPGARLYRSGDLARVLPDGNVAFVGRADDQLKIRGHRVEPEEIRRVLTAHPSVHEAVVVMTSTAADPGQGERVTSMRRLVGYYVPVDNAEPRAVALRDHCAAKLPEAMVPTDFVRLDELPLNANGKVDRRALPAPQPADAAERVEPRNSMERQVAEIWTEILGTEPGVYDNFFQSGGNSILAIRLTARMQSVFEIDLPIGAIFRSPTVAALAEVVERSIRAEIERMSEEELIAEAQRLKEQN